MAGAGKNIEKKCGKGFTRRAEECRIQPRCSEATKRGGRRKERSFYTVSEGEERDK